MATREKINQLRANPNIESVEMTQYGEPYEGEKKKGSQTARVAAGKGLDPVGQEDKDIDNDGDHDKNDKYLLNRRKVRGSAIETRKEEFIHEAETEDSNTKKIDYKKGKVKNKVKIYESDEISKSSKKSPKKQSKKVKKGAENTNIEIIKVEKLKLKDSNLICIF